MISPLLLSGGFNRYGNGPGYLSSDAGQSRVDHPRPFPLSATTLTIDNWDHLAQLIGLSGIYAGAYCRSAEARGAIIGRMIGRRVLKNK